MKKECEMVILWAERSMVRAVFEVQIKDEKSAIDMMLVLRLDQTIDQLAMKTVFICMIMS